MPSATTRRPSDDRTVLPISIPAPLRALIQRAAARDDRTLSDFIRMGAKERAHRVLGITDDDAAAA